MTEISTRKNSPLTAQKNMEKNLLQIMFTIAGNPEKLNDG
jgi:hypothetical protein